MLQHYNPNFGLTTKIKTKQGKQTIDKLRQMKHPNIFPLCKVGVWDCKRESLKLCKTFPLWECEILRCITTLE